MKHKTIEYDKTKNTGSIVWKHDIVTEISQLSRFTKYIKYHIAKQAPKSNVSLLRTPRFRQRVKRFGFCSAVSFVTLEKMAKETKPNDGKCAFARFDCISRVGYYYILFFPRLYRSTSYSNCVFIRAIATCSCGAKAAISGTCLAA